MAGLIPLGTAMQKTGAAEYLAKGIMSVVQRGHPLVLLAATETISRSEEE